MLENGEVFNHVLQSKNWKWNFGVFRAQCVYKDGMVVVIE